MANKHSNADVICGSCQSRVFYVGTQFSSNGNPAYTLRCAKCRGRNGEGTYVKNVSQEVYSRLVAEGRIVAQAAQPAPQTPPAQPQAIPTPPNLGIAPPDMGAIPLPQEPVYAPDGIPWGQEPSATPMPPAYTAPTPEIVGREPVLDNCPACKMRKPVSVENTEFSVVVANGELTYLNKFTGQVIFMHKIAYCPYCGSKIK